MLKYTKVVQLSFQNTKTEFLLQVKTIRVEVTGPQLIEVGSNFKGTTQNISNKKMCTHYLYSFYCYSNQLKTFPM